MKQMVKQGILRVGFFALLIFAGQACAELGPSGGYAIWQEVLGVAATDTGTDSGDGTGDSGDTSDTTVTPSPVSGVQSGTVTMNSTSETATITAVDTTQSFVLCYPRTDNSNASQMPTCTLTSSTVVTIEAGEANTDTQVKYFVVEFASGASVQTGSRTMGAGVTSGDITIPTSVDTTRAFAIVTARTTDTNQDIDEQRTIAAQITDGSTLNVSRNESGIAVDIVWQVVELTGASVQSGLTSITAGNTSNTAAITSVDTAATFIISSIRAGAAVNGVDGEYLARASLTDATTITFNRAVNTNSTDIAWFAVTMGDGSSVQSGSVSTAGHTETQLDATLAAAITTSRAVPFASYMVTDGGNADQDSGNFTPDFTSTTNLRFTRNSAQDRPATADYFVMEFTAP